MPAAKPRPDAPKPLGVRATPEQRRILAEAAKREHRSVSSFVLRAALQAAETAPAVERQEEVRNRFREVRPGLEIATVQSGEALAAFAAQRH